MNLKQRLLRRLDATTMPMQIRAINAGLLPGNTGIPVKVELANNLAVIDEAKAIDLETIDRLLSDADKRDKC